MVWKKKEKKKQRDECTIYIYTKKITFEFDTYILRQNYIVTVFEPKIITGRFLSLKRIKHSIIKNSLT